MKINDVINSINKSLEVHKESFKQDFFVLHVVKTKLKGNYYKYLYNIYLVSPTDKTLFLEQEYITQIIDGQEDKMRDELDGAFLIPFMTKLWENYGNFV